jgi:hypothetical protein
MLKFDFFRHQTSEDGQQGQHTRCTRTDVQGARRRAVLCIDMGMDYKLGENRSVFVIYYKIGPTRF